MDRKPPKRIVDSIVLRLLKIRKEKGLSHDKVAQHSKLHRSTISLTEARKIEPTLVTLVKISRALDCSLGSILTKAEKEK